MRVSDIKSIYPDVENSIIFATLKNGSSIKINVPKKSNFMKEYEKLKNKIYQKEYIDDNTEMEKQIKAWERTQYVRKDRRIAQWEEHFKIIAEQGLRMASYCRQHGFKYLTFNRVYIKWLNENPQLRDNRTAKRASREITEDKQMEESFQLAINGFDIDKIAETLNLKKEDFLIDLREWLRNNKDKEEQIYKNIYEKKTSQIIESKRLNIGKSYIGTQYRAWLRKNNIEIKTGRKVYSFVLTDDEGEEHIFDGSEAAAHFLGCGSGSLCRAIKEQNPTIFKGFKIEKVKMNGR
jgi:hypothetical protein